MAHCLSSRCILNHYRMCKAEGKVATCAICSPVMKHIRNDGPISGTGGSTPGVGPIDNLETLVQSSVGLSDQLDPGAVSASQSQGRQPASNADMPGVQQQELLKKQQLLQQVVQQKSNLFSQSQKLQQQLMSTSNQGQASQLQKQQVILQHLNQQFGLQQTVLQQSIQGDQVQQQLHLQGTNQTTNGSFGPNTFVLNATDSSSVTGTSINVAPNSTDNASKRSLSAGIANQGKASSNDGSSRPNKMLKASDGSSVSRYTDNTTAPSGNPPLLIAKRSPQGISDKCLPLVKRLIDHDHGWVFKDPVDPLELGIPEYFDVVKRPMDLMLVVRNLNEGGYNDVASFERDTKLVFENAILFNGEESDVGAMARELLNIFAQDLKSLL